MLSIPRYRWGARFYDTLSGERLVYRPGRRAAIDLLDVQPGQRVLVVGCGTGLDLPYLAAAVGTDGEVVGVDRSAAMLRRAESKVASAGWPQVRLLNADAADLSGVEGGFDAVLFTYSLAVIDDWRAAWNGALHRLCPGGKVAVVDTDLPRGRGLALLPLAALALWMGGVRRSRQVWLLVGAHTVDVRYRRLAHGHIHVAVGTLPVDRTAPDRGSR